MKSRIFISLIIISILLVGCAQATPTEAPVEAAPTEAPVVEEEEAEAEEPAEPIKIGFFGPLTGPTSQAGQALMQGAELRFEELNAAGGVLGRQVEYITCDDKSTPEEAVKCVQKLINQDNVVAIVGSLHSPHLMATGPILDEFQVPTVASGTGPSWCQQGFEYLWRSLPNAETATNALADGLADKNLTKLAVLYQNDDYGISGAEALTSSLSFAETVAYEAYNLGDKDWSGQIIKMIAAEPDYMAAWGLGDDLGPIFNQMRDLGWTGPIIAAEGATLPEIVDIAGENVNGVVFGALYYIPESPEDMTDPLIREFLEKYLVRYEEMPASDNAYRGYDAASVLIAGIERADALDAELIKGEIDNISDLVGLAGTFNYAEGGCEGIMSSRVWGYENQVIVPLD